MVKDLLRRYLGRAIIDYADLEAIICHYELAINARSLTYIANHNVLQPLTLACFPHSLPVNDITDFDEINAKHLNSGLRLTV